MSINVQYVAFYLCSLQYDTECLSYLKITVHSLKRVVCRAKERSMRARAYVERETQNTRRTSGPSVKSLCSSLQAEIDSITIAYG